VNKPTSGAESFLEWHHGGGQLAKNGGRERTSRMCAVRRYPPIAFFVLAYVFSWWTWPLYALGLSPGAIIGFGPFLAALVVLAGRAVNGLLERGSPLWLVSGRCGRLLGLLR
jgi:hypothetical protein